MTRPKSIDLSSTGAISAQLQLAVSQVITLADELGIEPAMVINQVRHYTASDVDQIANHTQRTTQSDAMVRPPNTH